MKQWYLKHPSIHFQCSLIPELGVTGVCSSLFQLAYGFMQVKWLLPWTSSSQGHKQTNNHLLSHNYPRTIWSFQFTWHSGFWTVESWRLLRELTKTQELNPQPFCWETVALTMLPVSKTMKVYKECKKKTTAIYIKPENLFKGWVVPLPAWNVIVCNALYLENIVPLNDIALKILALKCILCTGALSLRATVAM